VADREQGSKLLVDELRDAVGDRAVDRAPQSSRLLMLVVGAALVVAGIAGSVGWRRQRAS
jgi:hypothetical protein